MTCNRVASSGAGVKLSLGDEAVRRLKPLVFCRKFRITGFFLVTYETTIELKPLYSSFLVPAHNLTILPAFN